MRKMETAKATFFCQASRGTGNRGNHLGFPFTVSLPGFPSHFDGHCHYNNSCYFKSLTLCANAYHRIFDFTCSEKQSICFSDMRV